jgi:hypothetical protein
MRIVLEPGTKIGGCQIHRNAQAEIDQGAEPYVMRFEVEGRSYGCPLPKFQARTRMIEEEFASAAQSRGLEARA